MGQVNYNTRCNFVEIEDLRDGYATFCKGGKHFYFADIAEGLELPTEHLKVWTNHDDKRLIIFDPLPTFSEIYEGKRSESEMPKDKNSYMEMCRIIGMVETSHDFGEVRHIINPFFGDKNNLNEYAEDITFYNNLDSVFIPVLRGPRMSGPDISKGV